MLKNYIFDLGGVILDIRMQNAFERFAALGLPAVELEKGGATTQLMEDYQLGFVDTQSFCEQIAGKCNAGTTPHDIEKAWNSICLNIAERKLNALRRLCQRKDITVSLLSNTNELHWEYCCKNWFSANGNHLEDFFDHIFLSQELHLQKPDPKIFEAAIRTLNANPGETIFIDDSADNTAAAAACGLQTLHITPGVDWVKNLFIPIGA
ncbi:HAD family phosphatase [uncultured Fibrobacter sp.]|uniref:HAD family hydrolase n=1 Tax=uncultured Fibrobacter sp. TaxID=261512 RepID=UPI002613B7CA|nr:HAD family phosphatase [uncultured Fibrobacter sp.]